MLGLIEYSTIPTIYAFILKNIIETLSLKCTL